jgi:hypothetical protein
MPKEIIYGFAYLKKQATPIRLKKILTEENNSWDVILEI